MYIFMLQYDKTNNIKISNSSLSNKWTLVKQEMPSILAFLLHNNFIPKHLYNDKCQRSEGAPYFIIFYQGRNESNFYSGVFEFFNLNFFVVIVKSVLIFILHFYMKHDLSQIQGLVINQFI